MKLKDIVPWGRNLQEYVDMFNLTKYDLELNILGCGDGPASFNVELNSRGGSVISIDPIYSFSKEQIEKRVLEVKEDVLEQIVKNRDSFVWKNFNNPSHLMQVRLSAMEYFLKDYELGKKEGRYINAKLPKLPFKRDSFDLALSSHFLFLYSEHLDLEFHLKSILEMLRVTKEIRIFPIVTLKNDKSPHLQGVIEALENRGFKSKIVTTNYEFQKGGFKMLQVKRL